MLANLCRQMYVDLQNDQAAKQYLTGRGISNFTVDDLSIGYCKSNSFNAAGINLTGRIVFPIKNTSGDVIGFSGRILGDGSPKYLNSPASDIYDKSRVVYNLDNAGDFILNAGYAVIVEGCMDVAALWGNGIKNVVATCGTAITKWHVRALKKYAESLVLLYDDDSAGNRATESALKIAELERLPASAVEGLLGMDPDEYVKIMGSSSLIELINAAKGKTKR